MSTTSTRMYIWFASSTTWVRPAETLPSTPVHGEKLGLAIRGHTACERLTVRWEAVAEGVEGPVDRLLADGMPLVLESCRQ